MKILSGFTLTYIYTKHYKNRSTADIYKYYDDAKIMHAALAKHPLDYFSMLCGIESDKSNLDTEYFQKMNHWYKRNDYGLYNDDHTMIRFNALLMPFTFKSYHAHTVIMCFVSLMGLYLLYLFFLHFIPDKTREVACAVFLIPSVLFWGSGVLKEGLLLFGIGGFLFTFNQLFFNLTFKVKYIGLFLISLIVLLLIKTYWLPILLIPLICLLIVRRINAKHPFLVFTSVHIVILLIGFLYSSCILKKDLLSTIATRQADFIHLAQGGIFLTDHQNLVCLQVSDSLMLQKTTIDSVFKIKSGSDYLKWQLADLEDTLFVENSTTDTSLYKLISINQKAGSLLFEQPIASNLFSFIRFTPRALFNCLFLPFPWQIDSITALMASLENSALFLLLIICFIYRNNIGLDFSFLYFLLFTVLLVFILVGFTTPVAGAIVRYKMPVLPFMALIGVLIFGKKKL